MKNASVISFVHTMKFFQRMDKKEQFFKVSFFNCLKINIRLNSFSVAFMVYGGVETHRAPFETQLFLSG